jgi:N-acetyl-gamma-glutamyl-phosphate reductase
MHVYSFTVHKLPVGVLGASGYAGRELCALIARHPGLELRFASANERRGEQACLGGLDVRFIAHDDAELERCALVFSALPHGASAPWVHRALAAGAKVVDLSADLRPGAAEQDGPAPHSPSSGPGVRATETTHSHQSARATLAAPAREETLGRHRATARAYPYGLTELFREEIAGAEAVANPGCYPTAILLALAPLFEQGLVARDAIVSANAASGVTGAGSTPRADLLFGELTEDFRPYSAGNDHRHLPEMRATLSRWGSTTDLVFLPHLLPVARGILATITVPLAAPLGSPNALWRERYAAEAFIEVSDVPPTLRDVVRRNVVRICATTAANVRTPTLVVYAAIDNLVKGAAGQAIQNANLMLGLSEQEGLPA